MFFYYSAFIFCILSIVFLIEQFVFGLSYSSNYFQMYDNMNQLFPMIYFSFTNDHSLPKCSCQYLFFPSLMHHCVFSLSWLFFSSCLRTNILSFPSVIQPVHYFVIYFLFTLIWMCKVPSFCFLNLTTFRMFSVNI